MEFQASTKLDEGMIFISYAAALLRSLGSGSERKKRIQTPDPALFGLPA